MKALYQVVWPALLGIEYQLNPLIDHQSRLLEKNSLEADSKPNNGPENKAAILEAAQLWKLEPYPKTSSNLGVPQQLLLISYERQTKRDVK